MQEAVLDAIETDNGKPKAESARTCIATRVIRPVGEMIRFVAAPDGTLTPDLKANLPGRGVWVSADRENVLKALKNKAFAASLKQNILADPSLPDRLGQLLRERALQALSFANKAGELVCGATKVEKAFDGAAIALIHAMEGGSDGVEKLNRLFRSRRGAAAPVHVIFRSMELDMALGRSNVIHAALMEGTAARASLQWMEKITIYEGASPAQIGESGVEQQERAENE